MKYRDVRGKFTKYDRRKYLFDLTGNVVYVPGVGNVDPKAPRKPTKAEIILRQRTVKSNVVDTIVFTDRTNDQDLYSYFTDHKINQRIAKLKKRYPKKVLVASVNMQIGPRRFQTTQFKITDFAPVEFLGGKRKGRKYSAKDQIAYFIHDRINNSNYNLYKQETDHTAQVRQHATPQKNRGRYNRKQRFQITIKAVSKTTSKVIQSVGKPRKVSKRKASAFSKSTRKKRISNKNRKRS